MTITKDNPFDHFKRINISKERPTDENMESFNSFLAETYYSMYPDTVLLSELCSMMDIPDNMKETFLRGVIDKGQRNHFWPKSQKDEKINFIRKYFNMSYEKAVEVESLIPNSKYKQIIDIENETKS